MKYTIKVLAVLLAFILFYNIGLAVATPRVSKVIVPNIKKSAIHPGKRYVKDSVLVRIVSLKAWEKSSGKWYWTVTLKNFHKTNTIEKNRLELRAFQISDIPNKTSSAKTHVIPYEIQAGSTLNTQHYPWVRTLRTRQIKIEVWDKKYRVKLHEKTVNLQVKKARVSKTNPLRNTTAEQAQQMVKNIKREIKVIGGRYNGRGRWLLRIKNTGSYTIRKKDFRCYWRYHLKDTSFPDNDQWMGGKYLPEIIYSKVISLEDEGLYTQNQKTCLVKAVEFKIIDVQNQNTIKYTINILPPELYLFASYSNQPGLECVSSSGLFNFDITLQVRNKRSYGYSAKIHYEIYGYSANDMSCSSAEPRKTKTGVINLSIGGKQTKKIVLMKNAQNIIMGTYDTNLFYGYNSSIKIKVRVDLEASTLCDTSTRIGEFENCIERRECYQSRGMFDVGKEVIKDGVKFLKEVY
ncbi:MAG TPA: hypothetical protein ENG35_08050 [Desulfobacteraceae bacterium]|nr:hypothetical protein [Desulfobacteraceae bacterium]